MWFDEPPLWVSARRPLIAPRWFAPSGNLNKDETRLWGDCLAVTLSYISISHLLNTVSTIDCSREIIGLLPLCVFVALRLDTGHAETAIVLICSFFSRWCFFWQRGHWSYLTPWAPQISRFNDFLPPSEVVPLFFNWHSYNPVNNLFLSF